PPGRQSCPAGARPADPGTPDRRARRTGRAPARRSALHDLVGLALQVLQATAHEERLLGVVVVLALAQPLERLDRLADRHERALDPGELLGRERVLGQE